MDPLELFSEPFSPTGNVTSEGVMNQLGRPSLDALTLLIRETVQNSWDARVLDWGDVRYGIKLWTPSEGQHEMLRDTVFREVPERLPLAKVLEETALPDDPTDGDFTLRLLALSDRGTLGLGGPTRADTRSAPGEPRDYVDFLRNVGLPPDKPLTGGTYGYGKAALYLASRARTIMVYTRWQTSGGRRESRFQAAALGSAQTASKEEGSDVPQTGRHWWGRIIDGVAEPALDGEADAIAAGLGLRVMSGAETGTTLVVVGPYLDGATVGESVDVMVSACLWNFWPKMLADLQGNVPISFSASADDRAISVPLPEEYPPLHGFVRALRVAEGGSAEDGAYCAPVVNLRPRRDLGMLSIAKVPSQPRRGVGARKPPAPFEGPAHHVALMRQVRLVVRYEEGPRLPLDALEYAGVFLADRAVDHIFKASEPPTHDDWVDSFVELRQDRTAVRVALREIRAAVAQFVNPDGNESGRGGGPVAPLALALGGLLPGLDGPGAEVAEPSPGQSRKGRIRRARVKIVDRLGPVLEGTTLVITVRFEVTHVPDTAGTTIEARSAVVLDGGELEMEAPMGAPAPAILGWKSPDGTRTEGPKVFVPADQIGPWDIRIAGVPDAIVGIDVHPADV